MGHAFIGPAVRLLLERSIVYAFYLKNLIRCSSGLNSLSPAGAVGLPKGICAINCQLAGMSHSF